MSHSIDPDRPERLSTSAILSIFNWILLAISPLAATGQELLLNPDFATGVEEWIYGGDGSLSHQPDDGHLTPGGSAQIEGQTSSAVSFHQCISLADEPAFGRPYNVGISVKQVNYSSPETDHPLIIDFFADAACDPTRFTGSEFLVDSAPFGEWTRAEATLVPPPGTRSVFFKPSGFEIPDFAITRFDDASLVPAVLFFEDFERGNLGAWSSAFGLEGLPATQLEITGPEFFIFGLCYEFTVHTVDDIGLPAHVTGPDVIELSTDSIGTFFLDSECSTRALSITVANGASEASFFYLSNQVVHQTLTATSSTLGSAMIDFDVLAP